MSDIAQENENAKPFLTDVKTLRERARMHLETGNVTSTYQGDVSQAIEILQSVLATEIVCVLRYTMHAVAATGISSEGVKGENLIAERIAVDHYRELIRYFGDDDPATRIMLEGILVVEEEHTNDMHDLLVAHEGTPSFATH